MNTLYIWTYNNINGDYKKLGDIIYCGQLNQKDLIIHNSEAELMDSIAKNEWDYDQVLKQKPDRLPDKCELAGIAFLN